MNTNTETAIHRSADRTKGFTLTELLIVVAIIAVLVAISIPVLSGQLEKSREATDLANVRSAYAKVMVAALTADEPEEGSGVTRSGTEGSYSFSAVVPLKQKVTGWQRSLPIDLAGVEYNGTQTPEWQGTPSEGGVCTVVGTESGETMFIWGSAILPGSCWNASSGYLVYQSTGYSNGYRSSSLTDMQDIKEGQVIYLGDTDSSAVLKAEKAKGYVYSYGVFIVDTDQKDANGNYKIVWDSTEYKFTNSSKDKFTVTSKLLNGATSPKMTIQFFKKDSNGTVPMSQAEASALASLFYVQ